MHWGLSMLHHLSTYWVQSLLPALTAWSRHTSMAMNFQSAPPHSRQLVLPPKKTLHLQIRTTHYDIYFLLQQSCWLLISQPYPVLGTNSYWFSTWPLHSTCAPVDVQQHSSMWQRVCSAWVYSTNSRIHLDGMWQLNAVAAQSQWRGN